MQAIVFIGLQGSGKSSFYERNFASTHVRISMDITGTRPRERRLIESCIERRLDFVIDNTNPTIENRKGYIAIARSAGYTVIGYYFDVDIKLCLERNARRTGKARIPVPGIYRVRKLMQPPSFTEGFDKLFEVRTDGDEFSVKALQPL